MNTFGGQVPNLVIAQHVLDKMAAAAARYVRDETGEAMLGLVEPGTHTNGVPTLYVLETVPPDETNVVREVYSFEQGDERQFEIMTWYHLNWKTLRAGLNARFNLPLAHIGDWHKQPGYMIAPSTGDLYSALAQLDDAAGEGPDAPDFLLVPIVTLGHPGTIQVGGGANFLMWPLGGDQGYGRVDFWYIDRRVRLFQPIHPVVYPDAQLPQLPALPWHLTDEARASLEFGQLQHDGWLISLVLWDADGAPPLEVCIMAARQGESTVTLIVTRGDFPASAPQAYRAPFISMGEDEDLYAIFDRMWASAERIADPPGWTWTPDQYLVDYLNAIAVAEGGATVTSPAKVAAPQAVASEPAPAPTPAAPSGSSSPSAEAKGD